MKELDELIWSRISTDEWLAYYLTLAGKPTSAEKPSKVKPHPPGNAWGWGKMKHGYQQTVTEVPTLIYYLVQTSPGKLRGNHTRTVEAVYEFGAFASTYFELTSRLRLLFDGWTFNVPSNYTEVGKVSSVFEWEGGEGFNETLKQNFRYARIRCFVALTPQVPN